jgi:hypothetical protein
MLCFIEIFDEKKETVPILKPLVGLFLSQSSNYLLISFQSEKLFQGPP